jgi:hypothetical protein
VEFAIVELSLRRLLDALVLLVVDVVVVVVVEGPAVGVLGLELLFDERSRSDALE